MPGMTFPFPGFDNYGNVTGSPGYGVPNLTNASYTYPPLSLLGQDLGEGMRVMPGDVTGQWGMDMYGNNSHEINGMMNGYAPVMSHDLDGMMAGAMAYPDLSGVLGMGGTPWGGPQVDFSWMGTQF